LLYSTNVETIFILPKHFGKLFHVELNIFLKVSVLNAPCYF